MSSPASCVEPHKTGRMPYTAPLKTSSTQHNQHSDPTTPPSPSSPTEADSHARRVNSSRSYNSTSYLRRHRRCPSSSKKFVFPAPDGSWKANNISDPHASIRQSPPPVSEGSIPPGALLSPPESAQNSSDEESGHRGRSDRSGFELEELEAAVRSIEQKRMSSPERQLVHIGPPLSYEPDTNTSNGERPARPSLTKDARKVSHSRSFVANSIERKQEEALTSSPEESDRDDELPVRHPMVRKKSGELVRPALRPPSARRRPSSMPGTPTFSKAVHFDSQLEHIRHFLQLDKPQAVSAGSSPVEDYTADGEYPFVSEDLDTPSYEWDLRLANFPVDSASRGRQRVRLESLFLSPDRNALVGVVAVANLAFHKHVAARFTFDGWKTTSEVSAEYSADMPRKQSQDGFDRFSFNIRLDEQTNLERKTMFVCIRYNVNGQEFWDNNNSMNYQVNFTKTPKAKSNFSGVPNARPRINLPRSRSFAGRPHSMPSSLSEFSTMHRYISFGPPLNDRKEKHDDHDISHDHDGEAPVPIRRDKQAHQVFGNRYDFESSLSALKQTKPEHDRTTLTTRAKSEPSEPRLNNQRGPKGASTLHHQVSHAHQSDHEKPSLLVSSKPNRESSVYKELVDRYCFYGSPSSSPDLNRPLMMKSPKAKNSISPPSTPPNRNFTVGEEPRNLPRASTSPTLGYKYLEPMQDSRFKETQSLPIIRG